MPLVRDRPCRAGGPLSSHFRGQSMNRRTVLQSLLASSLLPITGCGRTRSPRTSRSHFQSPAYVTPYDIMTAEDELYFQILQPLCSGTAVASWPLARDLVALGQNLVDANLLANLANESIVVNEHPRARPLVQMVKECARTLQVKVPPIHIDGEPHVNAYVSGLKEPHVLVLTSSLLDLYEERPDELRFIIGHELGHLKAGHLKTHFLGNALVHALLGDRGRSASFRDDFIASATVGALLHWYRESEFSADRAGLLCVGGDTRIAMHALQRLLHQTKPSNRLFDPQHPDFDADLVLKNQLDLKREPFVKILSTMRQWRQTHPFIPERCAALSNWARSAEFHTIMQRKRTPPTGQTLKVTSLKISQIPGVDVAIPGVFSAASDPFVRLTHGGVTHETTAVSDVVELNLAPDGFDWQVSAGAGIIVELYDSNSVLSNSLIAAALIPFPARRGSGTLRSTLQLDVLKAVSAATAPVAEIKYSVH